MGQSLRRDLSPVERDCLEAARENLVLACEAVEEEQFGLVPIFETSG